LSVITENTIAKYIRKDSLCITSVDTAFIVATEQNLKNLFCQYEEKDARIRELEEQFRHAKKDEGGLREFKACVENVSTKLEETTTDMYAHLHVLQQLATHIMDQHNVVQTKNFQSVTILEGLNDMQ